MKSQGYDFKRPKQKKGTLAQCSKIQSSFMGKSSYTVPSRIWHLPLIHGQPSSSCSQYGCWTSKYCTFSSKQEQWWREKAKGLPLGFPAIKQLSQKPYPATYIYICLTRISLKRDWKIDIFSWSIVILNKTEVLLVTKEGGMGKG